MGYGCGRGRCRGVQESETCLKLIVLPADVVKVSPYRADIARYMRPGIHDQIESPGKGDDTRSYYPPSAPPLPHPNVPRPDLPGESAYFLQANRNKRSWVVSFSFGLSFSFCALG